MLVGHFGIAEFGKGARRDLSFLWLLTAAYLPDLVRLVITPLTSQFDMVSHSIPSVLLYALAIAVLWKIRGGSAASAAVLALACVLHWPADLFTGCKPTIPGGPWIGFNHYRRPVSDLLVEGALLVGGWAYARRSRFAIGKLLIAIVFAAQVAFLVWMYAGSQFVIGNREWMWKPSESLVPRPHVLETLSCRAPNHDEP